MRDSSTDKTKAQTLLKAIDTFLAQIQGSEATPDADTSQGNQQISDYELARRGQAVIERYLSQTRKSA